MGNVGRHCATPNDFRSDSKSPNKLGYTMYYNGNNNCACHINNLLKNGSPYRTYYNAVYIIYKILPMEEK